MLHFLEANTGDIATSLGLTDPDKIAALSKGLVSDAELKGHLVATCDGPLPASDPELKAQIFINGEWTDLEYGDNELQNFRSSINISFNHDSTTDNLEFNTVNFEGNRNTVIADVNVNISADTVSKMIDKIRENPLPLPDNPGEFRVRVYLDSNDLIPEDNSMELSINAYAASLPLPQNKSESSGDSGNDRIYEREWSKSVGKKRKFRAGVDYYSKFALYNNSEKKGVYAKTELKVPIYILNRKRNMLNSYCRMASYINRPAYTGYQYELSFFLNTLVSKELWGKHLPLIERGYEWSKEKNIGRFRFTIGPIPFKVDVGVDGTAGYNLSFGILEDGVFAENEMPSMDFGIIADGGPTIKVLSAGITSRLTLIEETVSSSANLRFNCNAQNDSMLSSNLTVAVQNKLEAIGGKFGLYAEYWKPFKKSRKARLWIYKTKPLYKSSKALLRINKETTY